MSDRPVPGGLCALEPRIELSQLSLHGDAKFVEMRLPCLVFFREVILQRRQFGPQFTQRTFLARDVLLDRVHAIPLGLDPRDGNQHADDQEKHRERADDPGEALGDQCRHCGFVNLAEIQCVHEWHQLRQAT